MCRFSSQQLERDATNMIRRAENAMKCNWNDVNNAFRSTFNLEDKISFAKIDRTFAGRESARPWRLSSRSATG